MKHLITLTLAVLLLGHWHNASAESREIAVIAPGGIRVAMEQLIPGFEAKTGDKPAAPAAEKPEGKPDSAPAETKPDAKPADQKPEEKPVPFLVDNFAEATRLRSVIGDSRPSYRYERDVEAFFQHSPAVVRSPES